MGQEAPAVTDRVSLGQPCRSCTGWQRIDTLRCIECSAWSRQNYEPLSELATCKESLHVQNVSQEDFDSLLGLRKEDAADKIERLTQENTDTLEALESQTAVQQALLVALVECKDALLKELVELKAQRASYPAKATKEMVDAVEWVWDLSAGFAKTLIDEALAAAPKDDRDERIRELEHLLEAHRGHATEKVKQAEAERDELKRQLDGLRAKCPPEAVLKALHGLMDRHDFPLFNQQNITHFMWGALDRIVLSLAKWKASKTAPKEGE